MCESNNHHTDIASNSYNWSQACEQFTNVNPSHACEYDNANMKHIRQADVKHIYDTALFLV